MKKGIKQRSYKLWERLIDIVNSGGPNGTTISFQKDFGDSALTVIIGKSHFHTYPMVTTTDEFIDYLYENLNSPNESDSNEM